LIGLRPEASREDNIRHWSPRIARVWQLLREAGGADRFPPGQPRHVETLDEMKSAIDSALRWLDAEYSKQGTILKANDTEQDLPTIWFHGGKSYSADGLNPVNVSQEQHNVLSQFLGRDEALDTKALGKAGTSNVAAVIKKLAEQFGADAIRRPEHKGNGYFIRVCSSPKLSTS